jgi:hypothetical protein
MVGGVAFDTFFSDTPALDDGIPGHGGCTMMEIFVSLKHQVTEGFPIKSKAQVPDSLVDFIRKRGAPEWIFSDNAKENYSNAMMDILRMYCIGRHHKSEPLQQNQNPAERCIQDIKRTTNNVMDRTGTPASLWLLCTLFVIGLFNVLYNPTLGMSPNMSATGQKDDISAYLQFRWWEPVYYLADDVETPNTKEKTGRWVGVAEDVGDCLTYWIFTDDTQQCIARSAVRTRLDSDQVNLRAEFPGPLTTEEGEENRDSSSPYNGVYALSDAGKPVLDSSEARVPKFSPEELVGRSFLKQMDNGDVLRAEVVRKINDVDAGNHKNLKMLLKLGDGEVEDIMSYVEINDLITEQMEQELSNPDHQWTFKGILGHQGPLSKDSGNWKGSKYNVKVQWEDGSITYEPLNIFAKDDPITCAMYAKEHDLLETAGWKFLRKHARRTKKAERMIRQYKLKRVRRGPIYKFGVQVPRDWREARSLQDKAGHTKWVDAEQAELEQLQDYQTFNDLGVGVKPPSGYQKIMVHFVYDVKHDGRHKARLVAGGHMTEPDREDAYSGVVSLRS